MKLDIDGVRASDSEILMQVILNRWLSAEGAELHFLPFRENLILFPHNTVLINDLLYFQVTFNRYREMQLSHFSTKNGLKHVLRALTQTPIMQLRAFVTIPT